MSKPDRKLEMGDRVASYALDGKLGQGGMGIVFRAHSVVDGTIVALKIMKDELAADELYRRRFHHEVRAAREVLHSHLVPILDAGEADGYPYLAMRYIAGGTLDARVKTGPLRLGQLLRLVADVASGLDALHRRGIVHRDVKPANIIFDDEGAAYLTDFGLAKGQAYTLLTKQGQLIGSVDYLAPELIRGLPATPASDIYAFGCVAFECLSGAPPFASKGVFEVGLAHLQQTPSDPGATRADVTPEFSSAVLQALAKDSERRPPSAIAYSHMLRLAAHPAQH